MAYTFGQGSALSPRVDYNLESSIYKGLAMGAQANKSEAAALAQRLKDAKVLSIGAGEIHPMFQKEAENIVAQSTAEMMLAAKAGQDPTPIKNVYNQRLQGIKQKGKMLDLYVQNADDKHYVDREVVSAIQMGDEEGYKKALEKYPENQRALYDPYQNSRPIPKRDFAAELASTINLDKDYDAFTPGKSTSIPGTGDVRIEMNLKPEAKRKYAIEYLQDPDVQYNITAGMYSNIYKQTKDALVKGGMKEEDAAGEAMVKVVENYMPSYSDKGRAANTTNIYNNTGGESPTMQPLNSVPIVYKMNVNYDDGTSTVAETELTTGKYFPLSLAEKTSIPSSMMRPIDGALPGNKAAVMDVKQGGLTSIPLVKKGSTIKFFDKESGKNIVLKAGDPINQKFLDVIKEKNPAGLTAVSYSPVTIYAYETKNSNRETIIKHGFIPASSSNLTAGLGNSKNTREDIESMFTQVSAETLERNKELKDLAESAKVNKAPEAVTPPAANPTVAPVDTIPKQTPVAKPTPVPVQQKPAAPGLIPRKTKVTPSIKPEQKDSLKGVLSTYDPKKKSQAAVSPVNKPNTLVSKPVAEVKNNKPDASATGSIHDYYNIKPYATQKDHEKIVDQVYKKIESLPHDAKSIGEYIKKVAKDSELTGDMILKAAKEHGVDPRALLSILQVDSTFGTRGKGKRTKNPGNVGNDDSGRLVYYKDWQSGVSAAAKWLAKYRK